MNLTFWLNRLLFVAMRLLKWSRWHVLYSTRNRITHVREWLAIVLRSCRYWVVSLASVLKATSFNFRQRLHSFHREWSNVISFGLHLYFKQLSHSAENKNVFRFWRIVHLENWVMVLYIYCARYEYGTCRTHINPQTHARKALIKVFQFIFMMCHRALYLH